MHFQKKYYKTIFNTVGNYFLLLFFLITMYSWLCSVINFYHYLWIWYLQLYMQGQNNYTYLHSLLALSISIMDLIFPIKREVSNNSHAEIPGNFCAQKYNLYQSACLWKYKSEEFLFSGTVCTKNNGAILKTNFRYEYYNIS